MTKRMKEILERKKQKNQYTFNSNFELNQNLICFEANNKTRKWKKNKLKIELK